MALAPTEPKLTAAPDPVTTEKSMLDHVVHAEAMVDRWLEHKDRSKPYAVALPRFPLLDEAGIAEIERRYVAAGWASAEIRDGVLHLEPTKPEAAPAAG